VLSVGFRVQQYHRAFLDDASAMLKTLIDDVVTVACGTRFGPWSRLVAERMTAIAQKRKAATRDALDTILANEETPHTFNDYLPETIAKLRHRKLKEEVLAQLTAKTVGYQPQDTTPKGLAAMRDAVTATFERNAKLPLVEHMANDLQITLQAYGKVAAKRINDTVTQAIRKNLFAGLAGEVRTELGVLSDERIAAVLAEGKIAAESRAACEVELNVLTTAEERLDAMASS
jgi:hypothetical protein